MIINKMMEASRLSLDFIVVAKIQLLNFNYSKAISKH
jgi:hypothetical protein